MDYAKLIEDDVIELNKYFAEVFELTMPFDDWRSAQCGQLYGAIDVPVIAPSRGKPDDVRTGFQLKDVGIEIVLVAVAPKRHDAAALGAKLALQLEAGIKQVQAFAADNLKMLNNLTIREEIPIKKDQIQKPPYEWLVQVAASGNALIAIYKNAQGEPIDPPPKYQQQKHEVYSKFLEKYNASHPER